MRACSIEGCENKHEAKGYCKKHYRSHLKYGDPLYIEKNKDKKERKEYVLTKPRTPYEKHHKIINEIEHKQCKICEEWFPMNEDYFYKNKSNLSDGFHTYCKECFRKKSKKYRDENADIYRQRTYEHYQANKEAYDNRRTEWMKENGEHVKEYYREYQHNNVEYFAEYRKFRDMHKKHEITPKERADCKEYFNSSCAYCGISEDEAVERYKKKLNMDHVDHTGANDLSNAAPACTGCNSSKWAHPMEEWYKQREFYDEEKLIKIHKWLDEDYKLYIIESK